MAENDLRHFGGHAQLPQICCKPAPECVPSVPAIFQHGPDIARAEVVEVQAEAFLFPCEYPIAVPVAALVEIEKLADGAITGTEFYFPASWFAQRECAISHGEAAKAHPCNRPT